jgi:predicted lipoprotein with Yx(FWY)xxD motif
MEDETMQSKLTFVGGLMAAALTAVACGSGGSSAYTPSPSASNPPTVAPVVTYPSPTPSLIPSPIPSSSPRASGKTISSASTRLGQILVDSNGRTVYLFLADSGTRSNCNSAGCVQAWPPVLTKGAPQAGRGVKASLLGTTTRRDGTTEVTYAGHPLYYFISDTKAGDVSGQGINAFGAPWYVVSPSGMQIG